jgi:hypothetical protein
VAQQRAARLRSLPSCCRRAQLSKPLTDDINATTVRTVGAVCRVGMAARRMRLPRSQKNFAVQADLDQHIPHPISLLSQNRGHPFLRRRRPGDASRFRLTFNAAPA